ncbi:MAG: LptF/LptG family permease [Gemmatimonadota bacterium]|jgi:lipopolysaccharide export system permease protein|nr:hypothetical protein [Gemmatimonadota bacterium]MDP6529952.1 LptF/LptG family permease [Gemmatimonadota bacterium]MDP6802270.1 LptF/LptG family permease [Gemmatimonadota bacterium]MDP7031535.1 LptF/LptG family permease [Gemmatimonadota bacterium]
MNTLDRYILKRHAGPFFFASSTITFIFVMRVLVDFLDLFASRNLDFPTVGETFLLSLGWILALTFPMAVLVAVVMAFGKLSQDRELDAMHAGGVSFFRVLAPVLGAAAVLSVALVFYNNEVLPEANHRLKTLTGDIHKMRPTIAIREGVFMDDFDGYSILVREVEKGTDALHDVTIHVLDPVESPRTIHAPHGQVLSEDDGNSLTIRLFDGEIHEVDAQDQHSYFLLDFETHDLVFDNLGTKLERRGESTRGDRELSSARMRELTAEFRTEREALSDSLRAETQRNLDGVRRLLQASVETDTPDASVRPGEFVSRARILARRVRSLDRRMDRKTRDIHRYEVEIHKKYSFPFACIVFVLVGAPLGARFRRGGAGMAAGLSFAFFLVYYMSTLGGEKLGDRGLVSPAMGMWGINGLLAVVGFLGILKRDHRFPFHRRVRL